LQPDALASASAHELLAALIRASAVVTGETSVSAIDALHGVRVEIVVTPLAQVAPMASRAIPACRLTPLMQLIVDQLAPDKPTKAEVIAMRLGKKCGGSFRTMLTDLVRFGVIRHIRRKGYLLAT
jgi:hypothetical protein